MKQYVPDQEYDIQYSMRTHIVVCDIRKFLCYPIQCLFCLKLAQINSFVYRSVKIPLYGSWFYVKIQYKLK